MPVVALRVGKSQEGDQRHDLLDPVHIARQRSVEQLPASHRDDRQQHEQGDSATAQQGERSLKHEKATIEITKNHEQCPSCAMSFSRNVFFAQDHACRCVYFWFIF